MLRRPRAAGQVARVRAAIRNAPVDVPRPPVEPHVPAAVADSLGAVPAVAASPDALGAVAQSVAAHPEVVAEAFRAVGHLNAGPVVGVATSKSSSRPS